MNISKTFLTFGLVTGCLILGAEAHAQVREISVSPAVVDVEVGGTQTVVITARDAGGNTISGVDFSWVGGENFVSISQDPTMAIFLNVEGIAQGRASVSISTGSISSTLTVEVRGSSGPTGTGTPAVMNIDPATIYLFPTEEAKLQAIFLRADGELAARERVTWQSLYEPAASVTSTGKVIGISAGQGVILAETSRGLSARAAVHVRNAPLAFSSSQMSLSPLNADTIHLVVPSQQGRTVASRSVRYASTNRQVVAVTPLGVVNAIQIGEAEIIVQGFGQEIRLPVSVHPPVQTMMASPLNRDLTVPVSGSRPVRVRFEAADGSPVEQARAGWTIGDPAIARYDDSTGMITGLQAGSTILTAQGPGRGLAYEWRVSVVQGDIRFDTERIGLEPGQTRQVMATLVDSDGTELGPVEGMRWQSGNPAVATVDENGVITGVGFGRVMVSGIASWGDTKTVDVFVQGQILVTSDRSGSADVYSVRADSVESIHRLTSDAGTEISASYSPDGTRIVFVSHQGTNSELMTAAADGSDPVQLTTTNFDENSPSFTPDGTRIVYSAVSQGATGPVSDIGVMNVDGSGSAILTDGTARRDDPTVSPDGSLIAFRSSEVGGRNIFVIGVDGSGARPITQEESSASSPRWFEDGTLGFVSRRRSAGGGDLVQVVMRVDVATGAEEQITPDSLTVTEFTVMRDGRLVMIIETRARDVVTRSLYVQESDGRLVEVPRTSELEQFLTPRARR